MLDVPQSTWFLAQLKPNALDIARRNLARQGIETFAPKIEHTSRSRGRFRTGFRPLFPGYLFVSLNAGRSWRPVNSTQGITRMVSFGSRPATVPLALIEEIRERCDSNGHIVASGLAHPGDQVRLRRGPFTDFLGKVDALDAEQRVWVLIDLMGRETRVLAEQDALERI